MIRTILVTDDNILDNAILRDYLYKERYNMISAVNGVEALELLEGRNVDLILLDLVMPVMDGFEFLKNFSKTHFYNEIPIIVTSSLSKAEDMDKVFKYNIFDYIIKPLDNFNRKILVNKIRKAIIFRDILKENFELKNK
jgi:response regulator RpfG family c-di-GMP phosphodiesterase